MFKKLFFFVVLSVFFINLSAQRKNSFMPQYYYLIGGQETAKKMNSIGITILARNSYGISYQRITQNFKSPQTPNDYKSGLNLWGDGIIYDTYTFNSFRICKEFSIPSTEMIRFGVELGPALIDYQVANFTPNPKSGGFLNLSSNYVVNYTTTHSTGISFRAKTALLFARFMSLEISFTTILSPIKQTASLGIYGALGRVREKSNKYH